VCSGWCSFREEHPNLAVGGVDTTTGFTAMVTGQPGSTRVPAGTMREVALHQLAGPAGHKTRGTVGCVVAQTAWTGVVIRHQI
jgi:hypothetical protein